MNFTCPFCGNNSFKIVTEHIGAEHAECVRCGEITAFAKSQMEVDPKSGAGKPRGSKHPR